MRNTLLVWLFVSCSSFAQGYAGIGLGSSHHDFADCDPGVVSCSIDNGSGTFKIYGGYQFHKNFSVEGSYVDFGTFRGNESGFISGVPVSIGVSESITGLGVDFVANHKFDDKLGILGRVGILSWNVDATASASSPFASVSASKSVSGTSVSLGFGGFYDFTKQITGRIEFQTYPRVGNDEVGKGSINLLTAGAMYKF